MLVGKSQVMLKAETLGMLLGDGEDCPLVAPLTPCRTMKHPNRPLVLAAFGVLMPVPHFWIMIERRWCGRVG